MNRQNNNPMIILTLDRPMAATQGAVWKLLLFLPIALIAILAHIRTGESLRTGAPALACINLRPFHGLHQAKPASASQFFVSQSSLSYAPGQNITVDIVTHSSERYFRGFIIQAYDPSSGAQIGHFLSNDDSRTIDSCSAATHRNNLNKKHVSLTWLPPAFGTSRNPTGSTSGDSEPSLADQWLGLRAQLSPIQPASSSSVISQRQGVASNRTVNPELTNNISKPTAQGLAANGLRQVRFRAAIVVTYEEFYTGFESSDQKFEKFDYAIGEQIVPKHN